MSEASITVKDLYESLEKLRKELEQDDKQIETKISNLEDKVDKTYTKIVQFTPVKNIVYGMVAIILSGFIAALVALIGWQ